MKEKTLVLLSENSLKPLRRKVLALSGAVRNLNKQIANQVSNQITALNEKNTCRVTETNTESKYIQFRCNNGNAAYNLRLNYAEGATSQYEITLLRGYEFKRSTLYTGYASSAPQIVSKELVRLEVDGVQQTGFAVFAEGFAFEHLVLNYKVKFSTGTVDVTLVVSSSGIKVMETTSDASAIPLTTGFITSTDSGSAIKPVVTHDNVMMFTIGTTNKATFEKTETAGNSTVKTIDFVGGVVI